jgi:hypothetical protein
MDEADEKTLRAKYLDWCSARIAERILDLGVEEIYALAHSRPPGEGGVGGEGPGSVAGPSSAGEESYRVLVQRATEALLERMALPPYQEWRKEYESSPARFDAEILGFWRESSGGGG